MAEHNDARRSDCLRCFGTGWLCRRCIEDATGTSTSIGCAVGHGGPRCPDCGGAVLPRNCVARLNPDHAWSVPCRERATAECFTVAGKWEPLCDRHGERYVGTDRIRPLGASQRPPGKPVDEAAEAP